MNAAAEVGVIGAGPAGARAAELLARLGADVLLLDPKAPWEKPCGGGLTASVFDDFSELEELRADAQEIRSSRIELDPEKGVSVALDRPLWIVSRKRLAQWQLQRALAAGAKHLRSKVQAARRRAGGWLLETKDGPIEVSFLVGADGAASLVRRVAAPGCSVELAPTRVAYPRSPGQNPDRVLLKFYPGLAGYLWDFPRTDHRSIGVGVPSGTWRRADLDAEIDEYRHTSPPCSCDRLERAGAVIGTAQLGHGDFRSVGANDYALLGDAAGFADPLTGEGIQNALRSAKLLARAWAGAGVEAYPAMARRAFAHEFSVARVLRRYVLETAIGPGLIEWARVSDVGYSVLAALVAALNEHDARVTALVQRSCRMWRRIRADSALAGRDGRRRVRRRCEARDVSASRRATQEAGPGTAQLSRSRS